MSTETNSAGEKAQLNQVRILVFGDSIAYGAWDETGGWVDALKSYFHKKLIHVKDAPKVQVYNLGIGGETTVGLRSRIEREIIARKATDWPLHIIVSIGINDSRIISTTQKCQVDESTFEQNLAEILSIAKKYADDGKVIVTGLTRVKNESVDFKRFTYENVNIERYDSIIDSVAASTQVSYCALRSFTSQQRNGNNFIFSDDKLHPTDAGHKFIYVDVLNQISKDWNL